MEKINMSLEELVDFVSCVKMEHKPTTKHLRENCTVIGCDRTSKAVIYDNGYIRYTSTSGSDTVVYLMDCVEGYKYYFRESTNVPSIGDISADTLLKMDWSIAVTLVGESQAEANLMHRKCDRKEYRVRNVFEGEQTDVRQEEGKTNSDAQIHDFVEDVITSIELRNNLKKISDKQRRVFIYKALYGMTLVEIAELEGVKKSAIGERYASAIKNLRKLMEAC